MTLHDAIDQLLRQHRRPMTALEIAEALNRNRWYSKSDGSTIQSSQIRARVNKYQQIFSINDSLIYLQGVRPANSNVEAKQLQKPSKVTRIESPDDADPSLIEKMLLNEKNFKNAAFIDDMVPVGCPGLYCIRVKNPETLPTPFRTYLNARGHTILYIGIAASCLNRRFLQQELRANGHGTFFRSLGAVLGFKPSKGSLIGKGNKRNYKFSPTDNKQIIEWINKNLLVNWVKYNGVNKDMETKLISTYRPLLNLAKNPFALKELTALRASCVKVANTI